MISLLIKKLNIFLKNMKYYKTLYLNIYFTLHYDSSSLLFNKFKIIQFFLRFKTIKSSLLIFYFSAQVCNVLFGYLILRMSGNVRHHLLAFNVLCACPSPWAAQLCRIVFLLLSTRVKFLSNCQKKLQKLNNT